MLRLVTVFGPMAYLTTGMTRIDFRIQFLTRIMTSSMQVAGTGTRGSGSRDSEPALLGHAILGQRFWAMRFLASTSGPRDSGPALLDHAILGHFLPLVSMVYE